MRSRIDRYVDECGRLIPWRRVDHVELCRVEIGGGVATAADLVANASIPGVGLHWSWAIYFVPSTGELVETHVNSNNNVIVTELSEVGLEAGAGARLRAIVGTTDDTTAPHTLTGERLPRSGEGQTAHAGLRWEIDIDATINQTHNDNSRNGSSYVDGGSWFLRMSWSVIDHSLPLPLREELFARCELRLERNGPATVQSGSGG